MTLAALQRDFRGWLTSRSEGVTQWIAPGAHKGLSVYHNAYRVQLTDCLRETFEKTHLWLGEDAFIDAARTHIENTPPHGWTLGVYGAGFDATLAQLYPDDPEVAELAWLDRALAQAFEGPDAAAVSPETLAAVDWDRARIIFVPTLCLGDARTNAGAIWSALSAEEEPPAPVLLPEPGALLIWRQDLTPCFRTIEKAERDIVAQAGSGLSFAALCATFIESYGDEGVAQAGAYLGQWIGDGLIADIVTDAD